MEISTAPVFKLLPEDALPIDIQQFLLCQSQEADKLVKTPSQIGNILNQLKLHEHHETGQSSEINKHIQITGRSILNQSSCHIKFYRKL